MDRQAKRKFDEFKSDTDIESTYQPWLDLEANTLATQAGHAAPYPGTQEPPPDNGEQMLGDYLVAQVNPYCSCSGLVVVPNFETATKHLTPPRIAAHAGETALVDSGIWEQEVAASPVPVHGLRSAPANVQVPQVQDVAGKRAGSG
jgi:hypothetical protein